ncbi:hypothetical protein [Streptomyces sp. NPDC090022]|uniref:hypothetical protein n=1 Tax=Streptomyces sp. NPDC090022 TaxID=3365920 RepID=UPI00382604A0
MKRDRAQSGRPRRTAALGACAAVLALAAAAGPASAVDNPGGGASTRLPTTNGVAFAYASIFGSTPQNHMGTIWTGTKVHMQCWADGAWSNGTNRWFFVSAPGILPQGGKSARVSGWISANKVSYQVRVPHC